MLRVQIALAAAACLVSACHRETHDLKSVVVSIPQQDITNVAKATVLVDYSGTGARISSEGGVPACAFILPGIDGDFADDRKGTLTIHTHGPRALRGPADIVACEMQAAGDVSASDLHDKLSVRVASAEDSAGKTIDVSSKGPRAHGAEPERSESAIEAAQEEAVKQSAAIAAASPPAPSGPAAGGAVPGAPGQPGSAKNGPGAAPGAIASAPGGAAAGSGGATSRGPGAASGPTGPKMPAGPAAASPLVSNPRPASQSPQAANNPQDNGTGVSKDGDPSYDDSPSDDERVPAYNLEFDVTGQPVRIGALQLQVTHLGSSGGFIGRGDKIDCVPLVDALVASNYPGERVAKMGLISLSGILTPAPVMRCGFRTREPLGPASFQVEVTDASLTNGEQIDPQPTVVIGSVMRR